MKGSKSHFSHPLTLPRSPSTKLKCSSLTRTKSPNIISTINPSLTLTSYKYKLRALKRAKSPGLNISKTSINPQKSVFYSPKSACQTSEALITSPYLSRLYENDSENSFESTNTCLRTNLDNYPKSPDMITSGIFSRLEDQIPYNSRSVQSFESKFTSSPQAFTSLKEEILSAKEIFQTEIQAIRNDMKNIKIGVINKYREREEQSTSGSERLEMENLYIQKIKNNQKKIDMLKKENEVLKAKLNQQELFSEEESKSKKSRRLQKKLEVIQNSIDKEYV
ncbi:unnamed protein product [Blepharisma stoltei]|uniref:Uncharacterized protein n=1 Tax=Blepharisma stoltei TaxID=1481888 RepID=A0AAU9IUX3_9CILI|nr:unnamed protein product [Blepharisma stoltei]